MTQRNFLFSSPSPVGPQRLLPSACPPELSKSFLLRTFLWSVPQLLPAISSLDGGAEEWLYMYAPHMHVGSCMCANGTYECDEKSPGGRLRIFLSCRERGSRAQEFSWEHQRKPMFLCCWGGGWTELPNSPVTTRTESELWRETLSPKQTQEVDLTEGYLSWGALRNPGNQEQVWKKRSPSSSQTPRRASARENPQYS